MDLRQYDRRIVIRIQYSTVRYAYSLDCFTRFLKCKSYSTVRYCTVSQAFLILVLVLEYGISSFPTAHCLLPILPTSTAYCLLPTAYCLLPTAYCLLPTAYCLLPTAYCLLPTAYCLLPTAYCLYCLLPTAYCLLPILPTAYCLLPTAYCLLPTAYCLLPTAYCLLPTAYCLLPTAYCLLPTAYCLQVLPTYFLLLPTAACCLLVLDAYTACCPLPATAYCLPPIYRLYRLMCPLIAYILQYSTSIPASVQYCTCYCTSTYYLLPNPLYLLVLIGIVPATCYLVLLRILYTSATYYSTSAPSKVQNQHQNKPPPAPRPKCI